MFVTRNLLSIAVLLTASKLLFAQQDTGLITGQVLDESGAPIANASVSIKNTETGIVSNITTDQEGSYATPPLRIGSYSVTVEAKGFKRAVRESVTLNVQDRLRVPFTLPVGDVNESIEVKAEAPLLQTDSTSLG